MLEKKDNPDEPYLKISTNELGLVINANFEDADGNVVMRIKDNEIIVQTAKAWDIVYKRRSIYFEDSARKIKLRITQSDNLDLLITGRLYLNGGLFEINRDRLKDLTANNSYSNCSSSFNGYGVVLQPGGIIF